MYPIKILVNCEESQVVCKAFRARGFEAYSCDLEDPSGGHPEWHLKMDAREAIKLMDWNLMIAHPPCTFMSKAGARWLYGGGTINQKRLEQGLKAKEFFLEMINTPIKYIAVENPVSLKIFELPPYTQSIHPYEYGHPFSKKTLLWLKNLPKLQPTNILSDYRPYLPSNTGGAKRGQKHSRGVAKNAVESSKTFEGVGEAMAKQWGDCLLKELNLL